MDFAQKEESLEQDRKSDRHTDRERRLAGNERLEVVHRILGEVLRSCSFHRGAHSRGSLLETRRFQHFPRSGHCSAQFFVIQEVLTPLHMLFRFGLFGYADLAWVSSVGNGGSSVFVLSTFLIEDKSHVWGHKRFPSLFCGLRVVREASA